MNQHITPTATRSDRRDDAGTVRVQPVGVGRAQRRVQEAAPMSGVPKFDAPVLSLPIMGRMREEYGDGPMRDAQNVMQDALCLLIERFARYCDDAYKRGLSDGFMQGCLASDDAKDRVARIAAANEQSVEGTHKVHS